MVFLVIKQTGLMDKHKKKQGRQMDKMAGRGNFPFREGKNGKEKLIEDPESKNIHSQLLLNVQKNKYI